MLTNSPISNLNLTSELPTIVDLMRYRSTHQPEQKGYIFLADGESQENSLNYRELDIQGRLIAAHLQNLHMMGERALLLYPPGLEFIAAFLGCLYAGVVAVPAYPPRKGQNLLRLQAIAADSQAKIILTTASLLNYIKANVGKIDSDIQHIIGSDILPQDLAAHWYQPQISRDNLAFLQYTSGSTGNPKGVMVSHGNLLHNSALIYQRFGHTAKSQGVIWLPPYHDMGLIGGVVQPLYGSFPVVLMSPVMCIQKPLCWLSAISDYKATTSGAPNFAYEMCVQKITPQQRKNLDLSSWEVAFCGAEPIRAQTLERFAQVFAECGFRKEAFYPCYGLAEATLFVSGGEKTAAPTVCHVDAKALGENLIEVREASPTTTAIVSCGRVKEQEIVIVNPNTLTPCENNRVGEIWVTGESVAQGYWRKTQASRETFQASLSLPKTAIASTISHSLTPPLPHSFLRTGDLGFIREGELFVTGRIKDTIIIRGRNYYPQDIELTVEQSHPSLQPGHGAAFGVTIAQESNSEGLVVVQEVKREGWRSVEVDRVIESIRSAICQQHQLRVHAVLLLKPGSIPKTSSGKIQRYACQAGFENGSLKVIGREKGVSRGSEESKNRTDKLISWLREYAKGSINSGLIDERRCIPPHIVLDFGNQGLLGMQVPRGYGGLGLSNYDTMRVLQQLGAIDTTLSLFVGLNNILGIRPILRYGSKALQDELLPILATGRELAAFAITEPGAGSNPQAITSQAIADNGGWRLRGTKIWSGSAAWAGVTNVFVQHENGDGSWQGITGFAVRKGTGMRQGPEALTMGMRGMVQNTIYLNDVPVTAEQMLGKAGSGMQVAQDTMMYGRLAIASASVGGMKRCTQLMLRYSSRRSVSTGKLLENPFVLKRLSEITAAITAVENLVSQVAQRLDAGEIIPTEIYTACKTAAPEFYWQAADSLVQILGGRGYIETNMAPQILRDARILRIFEGPTEALNMFLGSRTIHESKSLANFISTNFQAPEIAERLLSVAHKINQRGEEEKQEETKTQRYFGNGVTANRWAAILTGEVATWAILWAGLHETQMHSPSESVTHAIEWVKFNFEEKVKQGLLSFASKVLSSKESSELISAYIGSIGDIEQTLPGEDRELDELLQKEPIKANSASSSASPASPAPSASPAFIQNWLIQWLSQKLKLPENAIDRSKSFADYGIDSVIAVELAQDLQEWLNYPHAIEATIAWSFPTIELLANYLAQNLVQETPINNQPEQLIIVPQEQLTETASDDLESISDLELAQLLAAEIGAAKGRVR